jgi:uncharacterized protein YneF (UPF0154 family)
MPQENKQDAATRELVRDARRAGIAAFIFAIIAVVGLALYSSQYLCSQSPRLQVFLDVLGRGMLIACASFLVGVLLGFIFGIPRALQSQAQNQGDAGLTYHVNTNLEQISDWLTKIIVGVSLVELGRVPELFGKLGAYLSTCLGELCKSPIVAVVVVVLFVVLGFLAGYLLTRLYLTGAFRRAEAPPQQPINLDGLGPEAVVDVP